MAFIPVPNAARVTVEHLIGTQSVVNTLHFTNAAGDGRPGLPGLAQAVGILWIDHVLPFLSNQVRLVEVKATGLESDTAPVATWVSVETVLGGAGGESLPWATACVVTLRTAARGRSGRGRVFIGPTGEVNQADNLFTAAFTNGLQAQFELFRAGLASNGVLLAVVSRYENGQPRSQGLVRPVTQAVVRNRLPAFQRRRSGRR